MDKIAFYVATSETARREADYATSALKLSNPGLSYRILTGTHDGMTEAQYSRWLKLNVDNYALDYNLYMDADTRAHADLQVGFDILADGWDVVIVPSNNQEDGCLWHVSDDEREVTFTRCGYVPLQLQAGVFWFANNERVKKFFSSWRFEWRWYIDQDQGALLRALFEAPLKIWLLGYPWNGGALIEHHFGKCRV